MDDPYKDLVIQNDLRQMLKADVERLQIFNIRQARQLGEVESQVYLLRNFIRSKGFTLADIEAFKRQTIAQARMKLQLEPGEEGKS